MHKRYLKWVLPVFLVSLMLASVVVRPDVRALFSLEFWESLQRYSRVMRLVEAEYVDAENVNFTGLTDSALQQAVGSLDRYSSYMTSDDYMDYSMISNQEYVGVGIRIEQFSGRVLVTEVFEGGAAESGELWPGDAIVGVDGELVEGEALAEVSDRIRGEPGTQVVLMVQRSDVKGVLEFTLERGAIALAAIRDVELREGQVGYLRMTQFTDQADEELGIVLRDLLADGMSGLILDLRGNPGGRLDTAANVASYFLSSGQTVVTIEARRGEVERIEAAPADLVVDVPMIVLVDGGSASASEILAGALRDHRRAVVVGAQTFGKGSVQSVFGFTDGTGLKLTTARYLLPRGEAINGTGVAPDVVVELSDGERYAQLLQAHHLRRMDAVGFEARFGFAPVEDRALQVAEQLLLGRLAR